MKMSLIVFGALAVSFLLRRRSAALRHGCWRRGCVRGGSTFLTGRARWPLPFATPTAFSSYQIRSRSRRRLHQASRAAATPVLRLRLSRGRRRRADSIRGFTCDRSGSPVPLSVSAILLIGLLRLAWMAVARAAHHAWPLVRSRRRDFPRYGLRRPVTLLESAHPSLLVTWGLARPKVILPSAADAWTDERARVVLSHELAHIRRGDWIVQLSAELLRAIYWFNPLLWVACRRLRLESEHACDDEVMSRGVEGTDYATHLIELARVLNARRNMWLPAPAMARPSSLERRVRAMLNRHLDRGRISGITRAAIFLLLLGATAVVAAAQSSFVSLSGRISDEQGRGVEGVAVVLVNDARQASYEVKSNANGRYEFVGLPAGEYHCRRGEAAFSR